MSTLKVNGAELAFEVRGAGPDVLFVQGVGLAGAAWSPQLEELARDHRCIALDNRGIGNSTGDTSKLSVDIMARDALALMDALTVPRAHLVGHSLGGVIVQRMALLAPERVASLTLMCTFCGGRDLARPSARLIWLGTRSRFGTRSMRRTAFARLIMPEAYLRERGEAQVITELERVFGRPLWVAPPIADVQLLALRTHDERAELPKLARLRPIVLSGRHDPIASHASNAELARILGAPHRVWEDASHALPIQHAAAVNAALREHFARAPSL
ncbi:MAG TPA: alpha/beta hydrolase [Polyangiales bacterium]|nr:alpha/beta hydrolase [Polyangiales bacterium]